MTATDRAVETLVSGLDEIRSTIDARAAQIECIAAVASIVMSQTNDYRYQKSKLEAAAKSRSVAPDSLFRGLFVTAISSFESFVKMFISALVQQKCSQASRFSDLPENFRKYYVTRASEILSHIARGSVRGIPYNFSTLQKNIGICFSDVSKPALDGDVLTVLMGNPTWDRLEKILIEIGIENPFDQRFGSNAYIKAWGKATWKTNLSDLKSKLDNILDKRNLIVHATQPVTIVEQDVIDACEMFEALARGMADALPTRISKK